MGLSYEVNRGLRLCSLDIEIVLRIHGERKRCQEFCPRFYSPTWCSCGIERVTAVEAEEERNSVSPTDHRFGSAGLSPLLLLRSEDLWFAQLPGRHHNALRKPFGMAIMLIRRLQERPIHPAFRTGGD